MIRRTRESPDGGNVYYPPEFIRLRGNVAHKRERLPSRVAMWCALRSGTLRGCFWAVVMGAAWYAVVALAWQSRPWALTVGAVVATVGLWGVTRGMR